MRLRGSLPLVAALATLVVHAPRPARSPSGSAARVHGATSAPAPRAVAASRRPAARPRRASAGAVRVDPSVVGDLVPPRPLHRPGDRVLAGAGPPPPRRRPVRPGQAQGRRQSTSAPRARCSTAAAPTVRVRRRRHGRDTISQLVVQDFVPPRRRGRGEPRLRRRLGHRARHHPAGQRGAAMMAGARSRCMRATACATTASTA